MDKSNLNNSVILIDKPVGKTSFETIKILKNLLSIKKIGHSGTLDKFASGLLVVCTGKATKLTRFFLESDKRYLGSIRLGIKTDTSDIYGRIVERRPLDNISSESIKRTVLNFKGKIDQVPPKYSSLKISGIRASDIARRGESVELKSREVNIYRIEVVDIEPENEKFTVDISCSKGTYIRSLARDIGEKLSTGAHLEALRRIESGEFTIDNAVTLDEINEYLNGEKIDKKFILKPAEALNKFGSLTVNDEACVKILNGAYFKRDDILNIEEKESKIFKIIDKKKNLLAIADIETAAWRIKYLNIFN